jgi:Protein of unknown function (DUF5674)
LIVILSSPATPEQLEQMLLELKFYIKVAVDIERRILAAGGEMHYDSEQVLLRQGSRQWDIWAAAYMPSTGRMTFDSMVNLRPRQNRSMEILDANIKERVAQIIMEFLG